MTARRPPVLPKVAWVWVIPPLATSLVVLAHPIIDPWHDDVTGLEEDGPFAQLGSKARDRGLAVRACHRQYPRRIAALGFERGKFLREQLDLSPNRQIALPGGREQALLRLA